MRGAFRQADREALITLGLYVFFFVWWTVFAFGLGSGDPEEYSYVFGLPAWFFYSCVLGYPVMTGILWIVVRRFFADIPLDEPEDRNGKEENKA
ncbi:YhdT family protein [uncultured Mailhella sp.]|uniref:YhdT family protein n=1 Tax=uncultured Mailhella sp. TaxID=1981031 RepID=UPI0025FE3748|nr:YhdT family protein [uncultured Mailhella sp.]